MTGVPPLLVAAIAAGAYFFFTRHAHALSSLGRARGLLEAKGQAARQAASAVDGAVGSVTTP